MTGMEKTALQRSCPSCDTYQLCKTYDRIPDGEAGCDDWEPARLTAEEEVRAQQV